MSDNGSRVYATISNELEIGDRMVLRDGTHRHITAIKRQGDKTFLQLDGEWHGESVYGERYRYTLKNASYDPLPEDVERRVADVRRCRTEFAQSGGEVNSPQPIAIAPPFQHLVDEAYKLCDKRLRDIRERV